MAIHTVTVASTTMRDGYVYLTNCPVTSIAASAPEIPSGYTVVEIEASKFGHEFYNEIKNFERPVFNYSAKDTSNLLFNLLMVKQIFELRGKLASDTTDSFQTKKKNLRYLMGSLLSYETGFDTTDRRGGTFTVCRMRVIPTSASTETFREKFRVACIKSNIDELGESLDKAEIMFQLIEGQDKIKAS
jgi:hypothetical protein